MQCSSFEAGRCRSCTLLEQPYARQLGDKQRHCQDLLAAYPGLDWLRQRELARDLAAMPAFAPRRARLLDMFPQTGHYEVLVQVDRV